MQKLTSLFVTQGNSSMRNWKKSHVEYYYPDFHAGRYDILHWTKISSHELSYIGLFCNVTGIAQSV
jgi:hypothetical protein